MISPAINAEMAMLLVQREANILAPGCYDLSPLHIAIQSDLIEVIRMLLDRGANTEAKDEWQRTPLSYCSSSEACSMLIGNGANIESKDARGWTPLHSAVRAMYYPATEALLAAGANSDLRAENDSRTVWDRVQDFADRRRATSFFKLLQNWDKREDEDDIEVIYRAEVVS